MNVDHERYHPMDPACQQDPYPYYAALRDRAPVYWHPDVRMYFVCRHENVRRVLGDPATFSSSFGNAAGFSLAPKGAEGEFRDTLKQGWPAVDTMLTADPPIQTRYRKAIGKAFSTKRIAAFEPSIRRITTELLDAWPRQGRVDVMRGLTVPLPVKVIAGFLSIPPEREADLKRWSDDSVAAIGVNIDRARALLAARGIVEMQQFLASLLEERRSEPRDDFLSSLVATEFEDESGRLRRLEMAEMLSMVQQLMVAGNEATTKGMNEILKLLAQHPDEYQRIRDDPTTIPAVVDEGLRLATPNQGLMRIVTRDTEVEGVALPKGSMAWVMFASANRDERVFPDPDRFDPRRDNLGESLAFGRGAHFCIGSPLARLEIRVMLEECARRVTSLRIAPGASLAYEPSFILRGLAALELEVEQG